jgi:hypothetical protein
MPSKRVLDAVQIALALPIYQILNLATYANTRQGLPAKIATFIVFLPIIAITTACWATAWAIGVWLALRLFK